MLRVDERLSEGDRVEAVFEAGAHFDGPSLYQVAIDQNMRFLKQAIEQADLTRLRRFCYSLSRKEAQVA